LTTIAWNTTCRASAGKPCCRSVLRAKSDWEQRDRRSLTWRDTENFRLNVTPSILISSTWVKPETVPDATVTLTRLLGLTKIISNDLEEFNLRLLLHAHVSMLLISAEHDLTLVAGMIIYVSSTHFDNITRCDWLQVVHRDNIRGWPYHGALDDKRWGSSTDHVLLLADTVHQINKLVCLMPRLSTVNQGCLRIEWVPNGKTDTTFSEVSSGEWFN